MQEYLYPALLNPPDQLQYADNINGFVNLGEFSDPSIPASKAKLALQFIVQVYPNVVSNPLVISLVHILWKKNILKLMLQKAVSLLDGIGLTTFALVCEASHCLLYTALSAKVEEPWFHSKSGKKSLRDVWQHSELDFVMTNETAFFGIIQEMYELEKQSCLGLCPKLTDGHFGLKPFKKMKVSLAAQVLSHSVVTGLRTYVNFKQLDNSALEMAEFI